MLPSGLARATSKIELYDRRQNQNILLEDKSVFDIFLVGRLPFKGILFLKILVMMHM